MPRQDICNEREGATVRMTAGCLAYIYPRKNLRRILCPCLFFECLEVYFIIRMIQAPTIVPVSLNSPLLIGEISAL